MAAGLLAACGSSAPEPEAPSASEPPPANDYPEYIAELKREHREDQRQIEQRLAALEAQVAELLTEVRTGGGDSVAMKPRAKPRTPDPATVFAVPIAGSPWVGTEDARITIVKGFDFSCPYCDRVRPTLDRVLADYPDQVKIVYKHFIIRPNQSTTPARAACAAHLQGKFSEMEELIWTEAFGAGRDFSEDKMLELAGKLGLNKKQLVSDMGGTCASKVQQDQTELSRVGMRGTPGFYINGRFLSGARPYDQFKVLIDEELQKADERIAGGTLVERYYDEWVLGQGQQAF